MIVSCEVVIAGAGLAGLAAALRLTEAGAKVTLLETRKKLGGRATSFVDVRTGETLDNCQHVALRCCTNYLDFLARLGAADRLTWTSEQYWLERGGRESIIRPGLSPAPLHFSWAVLRARMLTLGEKLALGRAMWAVLRADRSAWQASTFAEFLARSKQSPRLIERFWEPVVVSACNMSVSRVCAASALQVFQEGFLAGRSAADIGVASVPLVELYDRAEAIIARGGGTVRLGCSVGRVGAQEVEFTDATRGQTIRADRVICALPAERAADVLDAPIAAGMNGARIEHSPILGVHIELDRPVMRRPHAVLVGAATQWLFRKNAEGRKLHAVISAADEWMPLDEPEIGRRVVADLNAYIPGSAAASVVRIRAVKEKRATFACTPAGEALRPAATACGAAGPILAGDYTQTGWPATMEGAVRSGYAAAALALGRDGGSLLVADQPVARLARWLGLRSKGSPLLALRPAAPGPSPAVAVEPSSVSQPSQSGSMVGVGR